jgi:hypothetical protein
VLGGQGLARVRQTAAEYIAGMTANADDSVAIDFQFQPAIGLAPKIR